MKTNEALDQFYLSVTKINVDGKKVITVDSYTNKKIVILLLSSNYDLVEFSPATTLLTDSKGQEVKLKSKENRWAKARANRIAYK